MTQPRKSTATQLYRESGLIYIRFDGQVETKSNGQKKIKGSRPAFSQITKQIDYKAGSGRFYSLLMGREFKPGRFAVLLDFDNKEEGNAKNGLLLAEKLKLDQYKAPKQKTPSGGLHYIFWVDAEQGANIKALNGVMCDGVEYNMDVKFKNGLCNCAPSSIKGYGDYKWVNPFKLLDIPKLPDHIYEMIKSKPIPKAMPLTAAAAGLPAVVSEGEAPAATEKQMEDIRLLCSCITVAQLDNWKTWSELGLILKKLGAPMSLWDELSRKSKKFKYGECAKQWGRFKLYPYTMNSLIALAKEGNLDEYEKIKAKLHVRKDVFADRCNYPSTVINTPFLITKTMEEQPKIPDQRKFRDMVQDFVKTASKKSLVLRSRYGSGKTTFMQRLIQEQDPKRVLFITYRQTLARDIMRNFGKLGFKNYLDSYDEPNVWESPRLIVQLDSLLNIIVRNDSIQYGSEFDLCYDMIVLDESESLLNHFDEGTMKRKEIEIWELFDELLKHSKKLIMMDGDVSERTLNFASSYGDMTYIKNINNESNRSINLICNRAKWDMQLKDDLERFYKEDKKFRICIATQSSSEAINLETDIQKQFPHLCVKRLVGDDSGATKKAMLEDINKSLEEANVFIYSPTIESGVDITIPVKKLYGILSCKSNSQRAYLQMLARCRNLEDGRIDVMNSPFLRINNNHSFWTYEEVLQMNKETVAPGIKFEITGSMLRLSE